MTKDHGTDEVTFEVLDEDTYAVRQMSDDGPQCIIFCGEQGKTMTAILDFLAGPGWEHRSVEKTAPESPLGAPEGGNVIPIQGRSLADLKVA